MIHERDACNLTGRSQSPHLTCQTTGEKEAADMEASKASQLQEAHEATQALQATTTALEVSVCNLLPCICACMHAGV